MKDIAIFALSVLCVVIFSGLCVLLPDNVRLSYELREAERVTAANREEICRLYERIENIKAAMTGTVKASWYGADHRGRLTASGERFDPDEMTAASPWLPLGSVWTVSRVDTGASVRVRITDRGPALRLGRGLDLSESAARELGFVRAGLATVRIEPEW
jgi:rare lipoprotein A (peptidoglycan hydrolase)